MSGISQMTQQLMAQQAYAPRSGCSIKEGDVFGRLTATGEYTMNAHSNRMYKCRCECGKESEHRGYMLVSGEVRSCGCLKRDNAIAQLPKARAALRALGMHR